MLRRHLMSATLALAIAAPAARAQAFTASPSLAPATAPVAEATAPVGPARDALRAGIAIRPVAAAPAATEASPNLVQPDLRRRGMPQMIIGGAALVGGLIIGDDVGTLVSLAGLGYGLYGLYLYLN